MALRKSCKERGRQLTDNRNNRSPVRKHQTLAPLDDFFFFNAVWIGGLLCSWLVSSAPQNISSSSQPSLQCSSIVLECPPPWQVALSSSTEKENTFLIVSAFCCYAVLPVSCPSVNLGLGRSHLLFNIWLAPWKTLLHWPCYFNQHDYCFS